MKMSGVQSPARTRDADWLPVLDAVTVIEAQCPWGA
jgi:hypothetical protein